MSSQSRASVTGLTCFAVSIARAVRLTRIAQCSLRTAPHFMSSFHVDSVNAPAHVHGSPVYRARLATSPGDVRAAQALRFEVFNMELDKGLVQSYDTGLDVDPFDAVCDHLIVEHTLRGSVIGTYRLQTGRRAAEALGYYSEREFDFGPFESRRAQILELGRACIHREHRSFAVLNLLWQGIARYASEHGTRYLIGCSSLTSQDAAEGAAAYERLQAHLHRPIGARCRCRPALRAEPAGPDGTPHPAAAFGLPGAGGGHLRPAGRQPGVPHHRLPDLADIESPAIQKLRRRGATRPEGRPPGPPLWQGLGL